MATVDGITVAKADQIDKKHISSMAVVGSDLVLTRENSGILSATLPAGGGAAPLGQSESWAYNSPLRISGEGGLIESSYNWTDPVNADGGTEADVTIGLDGKLELLVPGWYSVSIIVEIAFDSTAAVTYTRMAMDCGNSMVGNIEVWWAPILQGTTRWVKGLTNLGPIYSDGTAFIRPLVRWDSGHYGAGMHSRSIGANVIRLG